jgi:phage terminase small subunit
MLAQSQASVPPAPAWMSRKAVQRVGRVVEHAAELQLLDPGQLGGFGLDGQQAGLVAFFLAHLVQLGVVGQLARQVVQRDDHVCPALFFAAQFLGLLGVVPDRPGSSSEALTVLRRSALAS